MLELLWKTYFNDVEDDVLVEAVEDALGHTVIVPGSVDQQQILQVFKLRGTDAHGGKQQGSLANELTSMCETSPAATAGS